MSLLTYSVVHPIGSETPDHDENFTKEITYTNGSQEAAPMMDLITPQRRL
jgi:hypothetical protein